MNFDPKSQQSIIHIAPATTSMLSTIAKTPGIQSSHQIALYFVGFLIIIHLKLGYAMVTGSAIPRINPAKLDKEGSATDVKNSKHPKKI